MVIFFLLFAITGDTNMLTYTSTAHHYNLQYPQDWILDAQQDGFISFTSPEKAADGSHMGLALSVDTLPEDSMTIDDVSGSIAFEYEEKDILQYPMDTVVASIPCKNMMVMEKGVQMRMYYFIHEKSMYIFMHPVVEGSEATITRAWEIINSLRFS
jgi:hypothetical protein